MAKVVALSGAQGGGKSTLLNGLRDLGWIVDDFRVSRAVQAQLGWEKLDRVMDDIETMKVFQEEIFTQKYQRDHALAAEPEKVILTERSFADIAAYTSFWCWEHVDRRNWSLDEAMKWLTPYLARCREAQRIYAGILLLPYMQHVVWQNDPNRAKPESVSLIYQDVVQFSTMNPTSSPPFYEITEAEISKRVSEVDTFLRTL